MGSSSDLLETAVSQFRGKSPDEIASLVKRRGIKGRLGTTYNCPLAILLRGTSTGTFIIGRRFIVRRSGNTIDKISTPREMTTFLRKFDIGKYPDLIAPPPRCILKRGDPELSHKRRHGGTSGPSGRRGPIKNHISKLVSRFEK